MMRLDAIKRHRPLLLLVAALSFGALAAFGMRSYVDEQLALERDRLQPRDHEIEVVVASRDLKRGDPVGPETMALRRIPREFVPGTVVLAEHFESHVGGRLGAAMRAGEPLIASAVEGADAVGFSARIREGIRAMTISVDEVNSLSGMLQPGDRIDLQWSVRPPAKIGSIPESEMTIPLIQDLQVLATGRQVRPGSDDSPGARNFTTITVEATPEQAQRLIVAQRNGRLTALLRNREDRRSVSVRPMDVSRLLGPAPVSPPVRNSLEVIVGGRGTLAGSSPVGVAGSPVEAALMAMTSNMPNATGAAGRVGGAYAIGGPGAADAAVTPTPAASNSPAATPSATAGFASMPASVSVPTSSSPPAPAAAFGALPAVPALIR